MKGGSSSTTTKQDVTNVTTNTTTTIRDIGLTGQNAVDALETLEGGVLARSEIAAKLIQSASADIAKGYNNLGAVTQNVLANFTAAGERIARNEAQPVIDSKFIMIGSGVLAAIALLALKK